jgi:hypothetical protein
MMPDLLARVTAEAAVPEQVVPFVCAVGGLTPRMVGSCVFFSAEGEGVLVGYPLHDPLDLSAMSQAVDLALAAPGLKRITVLGPARPAQAPKGADMEEDWYYALPLPPPAPGQKLKNLLRRAGRELIVEESRLWEDEHAALIRRYLDERLLSPGTRHIFRELPRYLASSEGSLLLSARLPDGRLAAFAVGEFAALRTAFFMFCFRAEGLAPPGSADLLLSGLLERASERGHVRMNLGLGVNEGIRFFKRKWGASPFLPYVQTSWTVGSPGVLSRLARFLKR